MFSLHSIYLDELGEALFSLKMFCFILMSVMTLKDVLK